MKIRELRTLAISTSFLLICAACSSSDKDGVELTTPWLGPLHGFERVSGKDDFGVFLKSAPGITTRFDGVVLTPPEFTISSGSDLEAISPAAYGKIKEMFVDVFQQEFTKQFPSAKTGADRNATSHFIHAALTNVTITRKTNNTRAAQLSDLTFSFEGSTLEVEIRVQKSNARQAVVVLAAKAANTTWNNLRAQLGVLASQAAAESDKARGAINARADQPAPPAAKTPVKK